MNLSGPVALVLLGALFGGCYNPHIKPGAFICAANGDCPDNFQCSHVNNRCYPPDAGPDVFVCDSVTPDASTCARPGQPCNPACASGCSCGWCGVRNGAVACLTGTPGTKANGDNCDPGNANDCAPGLYCRTDCGTVGRCHKFCDSDDDCAGTSCNVTVNLAGGATVRLCAVPNGCDPIAGTGCGAGFGCYSTGTTTECDCAGTNQPGAACGFVTECMPGYGCIGTSPQSRSTCLKICKTSADCGGAGTCMNPASTTYGYCSM